MTNLTTADIGKLARLSNGLVVGPLKTYVDRSGTTTWYIYGTEYGWGPLCNPCADIVEVLDMPTKKLTITKDDVGRWAKLRNGWTAGPIVTVGHNSANLTEIGNCHLDGTMYYGRECSFDIIAVIDPPDREDHA